MMLENRTERSVQFWLSAYPDFLYFSVQPRVFESSTSKPRINLQIRKQNSLRNDFLPLMAPEILETNIIISH
jgi:hypothetical protein